MEATPNHDGVRRSYDEVAGEYAARLSDELAYKPLDRALLAALIEQTEAGSPVADLGCGPGHVTRWLADRGARAVGIDLSPRFLDIARRSHPQVQFREGDFLALPASDGEFGSVVALYSVIHLEPPELVHAFAEMRGVLRPSGRLLMAFHAGTEVRHRHEWWGHPVDVTFRFLEPDTVVRLLEYAGFAMEGRLERPSYPEEADSRRAFLLARRGS